jgi:hypothetical protein
MFSLYITTFRHKVDGKVDSRPISTCSQFPSAKVDFLSGYFPLSTITVTISFLHKTVVESTELNELNEREGKALPGKGKG